MGSIPDISRNPCSEILLSPRTINDVRDSYGLPKLDAWRQKDVLSTASGSKTLVTGSYQDSLDVDFDSAVWRIYMPGVPKEDVQVFTVKDQVHVDVSNGAPRKTFQLAEGESVKSTKLELGVLTITIDRPDKRQSIEIE